MQKKEQIAQTIDSQWRPQYSNNLGEEKRSPEKAIDVFLPGPSKGPVYESRAIWRT